MSRHIPAPLAGLLALLALLLGGAILTLRPPTASAAPLVTPTSVPTTTPGPSPMATPPPGRPTESHGGVPYDPSRDRGCADCGPNGRRESAKERVYRWAGDCGAPACASREAAVADSVERLYSEYVCSGLDWADSGFLAVPPGWATSRHNRPELFASQTCAGGGGAGSGSAGPGFGLPRIDPKQWVVEAVAGVVQEVSDPLADAVKGMLYQLLFTGGELTYDHPTVRELWAAAQRLANLLLVVLAIWSLAELALGQAQGRTYHEALECLGRVLLGLALANFSMPGLRWLVRFTDLATAYFAGADSLTTIGAPNPAGQALATALVWLVFWLVAALFFCQVLVRIALIDLCLILAPVALVCWAHPRLQRVVRLWWTILAGLLAGQVAQVVALRLALSLAAAPALGANPLLNGLVLIALLCAGMKAPALLGSPRGGEASGVLTFLSYLAIRTAVSRAAGDIGALVGGGRSGSPAARGGVAMVASSSSSPPAPLSAPPPWAATPGDREDHGAVIRLWSVPDAAPASERGTPHRSSGPRPADDDAR